MSKYYKADDVINKYAEMIASDAYWEYGVGNGKVDDDSIDFAKMYFADLPTIEVSEDCISREWVKGICENMLDEEMLGHMLGYIEDAPSAVPHRAEGEWEVVPRIPLDNYKCSECGAYSGVDFNYCPNCGAKMKGASDGTDVD